MNIRNSVSSTSKFETLLEDSGYIRFAGFKIRSLEGFQLLRYTISVTVLIAVLFSGIIFSKNTFIYSLAASLVSFFIPSEYIKRLIKRKGKLVLINLPDIIDLLASLLKAGLTLEQAISYLADNYKNPVCRLLKIYRLKVFEGLSRDEAFNYIGRISLCNEFKSFIKVIYQAEIMGNPVVKVLKDMSRTYRNNQRDFLKMRAERLESNLIVVIFVFIFLPMLAVFLLPVIPQLKFLF